MPDDITGSVAVEVFPVAKGWVAKLEPQILQGSDALAQKLADKLASRIPTAIGDAIGRGLDQSGVKAKAQGAKQGEQFGSAFGKAMQTRLKAALDNLPDAKVGVNATDADRRLEQLRKNIATLSKTVGVHVSDTAALAAIKHVQLELEKLQHKDNAINVRVNAGAASLELAALRAQISSLSGDPVAPSSSGGGLSLPSLPITALLAALPLVGPLAGAATSALGGLAGAGGAAGLAVKGLNNEINAGTGLGHQFSVELGGLHGDLANLESTAAHASAGGFLTALDELHKYAPQLRPLVAGIAADLGQAGATTAHALISALKTAAPLLADGGRYAELLATKLDSAAQSPQFRQFINYARQELPIVGKDLADLVKTAADLATSLQPIGDELLSRLDKITTAADKIPAIIDKLNHIPGLGTKGGSKGISGILGNAVSQARNPIGGLVDLLPGGKKGSAPQVSTDPAVTARKAAVAAAARAQDAALIHTVQVLGTTIPAYRAAASAAAADAAQLAITTEKMVQQNSASGLLKQALDKLDGKQLSAAQSQNQFEQALVSMAQKIGKGDAAVRGLTSSAVANRGELLNLVTAAESAAGTTGDLASSSDAAKANLIQLRQQIINNAVAHGEDRDAVTKYINTVLDINKLQVTPTLLDRATDKVMAQLAAIRAEVTKTVLFIDGQVPVLHVSTYNPATKGTFGGKAVAEGGFISGPGTATSDSINARLSNGEFVVRAAQTAKHRSLLENLNRGTAGFADGGIVTITPSASSGKAAATAANTKALALATARANIRFTTSLDLSGLARSALGSTSGVAAIIRKLITDVHSAAAKGVGSNALIAVLQKDNTKLQALANQRVALTGKLKAADNLLAAERKLFSDEQAKVAASVASVFDITNVNGPTPVGTANPALFLKNLQAEANQANKFAAQLTQLRKSGLDKGLIAQLGEAGVGGAGQAVQSLASFTPAQIAQVNALQAKVAASSQVAGNSVASALYQAGIDSAEGYVKGLNSKLSSVNQAATDLANTVIKQIKKTLGIHSPSTVAHALAGNTVQGWVNGVDDRLHLVSGAAGRLANAAVQPGQFGRSGGKGIRDYHQHLHMQPGVDPRSFLADARRELAREMK